MLSFSSRSSLPPPLPAPQLNAAHLFWVTMVGTDIRDEATSSLGLQSPDQLETISACSAAFPGELILRFMTERKMFPCGHLMFNYRAIKIVRIGYFQPLAGANPAKVPSWHAESLKAAKFPTLLNELLFTPASYLHCKCWHLCARLLLGDGR